jgi:asparagine synthase (glutamine-hydrolysing)
MCGIVAVYDADGAGASAEVAAGLRTLRHRGPDAAHVWQSPDGAICLGHARLSIIDLAHGDQPLANEDESIHCVVNGEFYDFERIRRELEGRGHRFRTHSDSEILLHLYEDLGVECLRELRGEFAFVLWDARRHVLMAARDRFGIKPLFYSRIGERLLFASEVKALHAAGVAPAWDEQGFLETFSAIYSASPTLFRDVSAIPPGHYLLARPAGCSLHKYWDFEYPVEEHLPARRDEERIEEFAAVLDEAVRLRLRADVPVGCYLSGGIDSCSVLALMAKHAPGRVRAFSLSFDHELYDEGPIAREMAQLTGAEFTMIPMSHGRMAADLSDALWHNESFFLNAGSAAKFALSRAVRDAGYKVVLTGEGSDEVLAGYAFFRQDVIRHGSNNGGAAEAIERLRAANTASGGLMFTSKQVTPVAAYVDRIGYFPSFLEARKAGIDALRPLLSIPYETDEVLTRLLNRVDIAGQLTGRHVLNQSLYLNNKTILPGYILSALGDRVEMAHSIEARLPFLDHHVVEYTRRIPVDLKIRGTVEKYLLREAMKPMLTTTVYNRQKHPFLSPPALLKPDEPLHALLQDTLRGRALDRVPYLRRTEVAGFLDRAAGLDLAGRIAAEFPLMMMLSACLLAERFGL